MSQLSIKKGFTLLEVLLVIAIIGILAAIVIVALNPNKQLGDTRNAQRKSDVNTILNAVYQYDIDNSAMPSTTPTTTVKAICRNGGACTDIATSTVYVDLYNALVPKYVVGIPADPQATSSTSTNYTIFMDANSRVTVSAPGAENGMTISVSR